MFFLGTNKQKTLKIYYEKQQCWTNYNWQFSVVNKMAWNRLDPDPASCHTAPTTFFLWFMPRCFLGLKRECCRCYNMIHEGKTSSCHEDHVTPGKTYTSPGVSLIVPNFTISFYSSSYTDLFFGLILAPFLYLNFKGILMASPRQDWMQRNRSRKKRSENETKNERITWTAVHRNGKIRDYWLTGTICVVVIITGFIAYMGMWF